ncbi:probable E3 ubiquitin-protein ligase XERICO [Carica papaya]|uniref:probable E3 ubiquitin-protein ligase XERICO n=1 Tax=Carica papaya TaxID=3649 RepID=UPI000B8C9841|nr:probable E3 ubiquitin-protein ligase XERICO [Carica papaya]
MPELISITSVLHQVFYFTRLIVTEAITHLNLLLKPPAEQDDSEELSASYVFVVEGPCPSVITVPIQELMELIKNELPVVEYSSYRQRFRPRHEEEEEEEEDMGCRVCLSEIQKSQEIRELVNCCHVFHRGCLDTWVDQGQVTCPLCRSMLFPAKGQFSRIHH